MSEKGNYKDRFFEKEAVFGVFKSANIFRSQKPKPGLTKSAKIPKIIMPKSQKMETPPKFTQKSVEKAALEKIMKSNPKFA